MNMYEKTSNGQQEINANAAGLSMMERRILILINGENDVETVAKLSLCDDIDSVVNRLLELDLIEPTGATPSKVNGSAPSGGNGAAAPADAETTVPTTPDANAPVGEAAGTPAAAPAEAAADTTELDEVVATAREFMCNTLQAFGNRTRIADLNNQIAETTEVGTLKGLVKPWYQAISDTPGGMYQADDLRKEVLDLLQREEAQAA